MKLHVEIDQAECFRLGINAPESSGFIEVDPATLPKDKRGPIADRMNGISVMAIAVLSDGRLCKIHPIKVIELTIDSLLRAIEENAKQVEAELAAYKRTDKFLKEAFKQGEDFAKPAFASEVTLCGQSK